MDRPALALSACDVSGNLAYVAAIERSVASTFWSAPDAFALRVTTIFQRERGQWKAVHRLGDPLNAGSREALERRRQQGAM